MGDGNWIERITRPSVQVSEQVNIETNFKLPALKAFVGITVSLFALGLGLVWALWITPPDIAKDVAWFIFLFGTATSFFYGTVKRGFLERDKVVAIYGFISGSAFAILMSWIGSLPDSWWGMPPIWFENGFLMALQYVICLGIFGGGLYGFYWFAKEIVTPYELTGRERVAFDMWLEEKRRAEVATIDDKTWFIQAQIANEEGKRKQHISLQFGVHPDNFATWAKNILEMSKPDLTYGKWAGRGRLFSRPDYDQLTEELLARGVIAKDGQAQNAPLVLTRAGRAVLCEWLNEYEDS